MDVHRNCKVWCGADQAKKRAPHLKTGSPLCIQKYQQNLYGKNVINSVFWVLLGVYNKHPLGAIKMWS